MANQDEVLGQALGTGGADVVLTQHFKHRRAGEACDECRQADTKTEGRQQPRLPRIPRARRDRQPLQPQTEDDHEENSEHKPRGRDEER